MVAAMQSDRFSGPNIVQDPKSGRGAERGQRRHCVDRTRAAGLAVRIWSPDRRRLVTWCAAAIVLVIQFTAAVQSFIVLDGGLTGGTMAALYFAGLLAGVTASLAAALVAHLLAGELQEMLLMSRQILAATLGPEGGAASKILLALVIALAGLGAKSIAARRAWAE
jgi:hypothetical protein